jgi:shikimate kinase
MQSLMSTAKARAVFLVGFMGAGKTATGEALAHLLGWRFVDLDARIEEREERSIAEIFKTDGESAFRQIETAVLGAVLAEGKDRTVVALGGGAFSDPQNSLAVQRAGTTVFLEASPQVLLQRVRMGRGKRPLGRNESEFLQLFEARVESYRQADVTVNTENRTAAEVAAEIANRLELQSFPTQR